MNPIYKLIYMILPVILGGVFNMVFMKLPLLNSLKTPLDMGRSLKDGKRIFGDNKTWKGFLGMIAITSLWMVFFQMLAINFEWANRLSLIPYRDYSYIQGLLFGALWGMGYVLAELPNSFIKRRLSVPPGQNVKGLRGVIFAIFDQIDSVIGCLIMIPVFYAISIVDALAILILGGLVHFAVNVGLFYIGLKKQRA